MAIQALKLRNGRGVEQAATPGMVFEIAEVNTDYDARSPQWAKVRDVIDGEEAVKAQGVAYLPQPKGQNVHDYRRYLARASFYGVAERTLRGLVGLVLRVQPDVDLPTAVAPLIDVLTPEGYSLAQTVREALREVLSLGRYGLLVDLPPSPSTTPLPYVATYRAEEILNWEERIEPGKRVLTRVVLVAEPATSQDETTFVLRELFLDPAGQYTQRVWRRVEPEATAGPPADVTSLLGSFEFVSETMPLLNGVPLTEIPFWFVNPYDHRPRTDKPPFLDLANVNLAHYRNSADYEQGLFQTAQATPYIFGVRKEDIPKTIGSSVIWSSSNPDVKAGFVEAAGTGIAPLERAMTMKERRMAVLGARIIRDFEKINISAETARLEARSETSVLFAVVDSVESAFVDALAFAIEWAAATGEPKLDLNRDFLDTRLSPAEITALVLAWQSGALSDEALHTQWQRGEVVDPDRDFETERGAAAADLAARAKAVADAAAVAAARAAAAAGLPPGDDDLDDEGPPA